MKVKEFNDRLALRITSSVSTMACAYLFAAISLTSLPSVLRERSVNADVQWVAQTFLQLVLLSIIMVGQRLQAEQTIALHKKIIEHHKAHTSELFRIEEMIKRHGI